MKVDFNLSTWEDWTLGICFNVAEDESGMHRCLEIGLLFFDIQISYYSDDIDPYNLQ